MFWGVIVKKGKRYAQTVSESFQITTAAIQTDEQEGHSQNEDSFQRFSTISLYVEYESNNYLICTLSPKNGIFQVPLKLQFESGSSVTFFTKGGSKNCRIHLTGFKLGSGQNKLSTLGEVKTPLHMSTPNFKEQKLNNSEAALNKKSPQSILVSGKKPKTEGKDKKRVSIKETPTRHENDDSDEDNELRLKIGEMLNGAEVDMDDDSDFDEDEDDDEFGFDDEDDNEEVIDIDDDEEVHAGQDNKNEIEEDGEGDEDSDEDDEDEDEEDEDEDDDDEEDDDEDETEDIPKLVPAGKKTSGVKNNISTPQSTPQSKKGQTTPVGNKTPENAKKGTPSGSQFTTPNQSQEIKTPSSVGHTPIKFVSKGGVMIQEVKYGTGTSVKPGKMVTVGYVGRLKQNNKQFDASQGFKFRVGKGEVIRGWDVGLEGMKVGGKRKLVIPPHMAYGKKGAPPAIPPNATLQFEIEVKNVS